MAIWGRSSPIQARIQRRATVAASGSAASGTAALDLSATGDASGRAVASASLSLSAVDTSRAGTASLALKGSTTARLHTFEGGSEGATITTSEVVAHPADSVSITGGSTATYRAASAFTGSFGGQLVATAPGFTSLTYNLQGGRYQGTPTSVLGEFMFRINGSWPSGATWIAGFSTPAFATIASLELTSTGFLRQLDAAGAIQGSSAGALTVGSWYKIRLSVIQGTSSSNGTITTSIYTSTGTLVETIFDSSADTATAADYGYFGVGKLAGAVAIDLSFDNVLTQVSTGANLTAIARTTGTASLSLSAKPSRRLHTFDEGVDNDPISTTPTTTSPYPPSSVTTTGTGQAFFTSISDSPRVMWTSATNTDVAYATFDNAGVSQSASAEFVFYVEGHLVGAFDGHVAEFVSNGTVVGSLALVDSGSGASFGFALYDRVGSALQGSEIWPDGMLLRVVFTVTIGSSTSNGVLSYQVYNVQTGALLETLTDSSANTGFGLDGYTHLRLGKISTGSFTALDAVFDEVIFANTTADVPISSPAVGTASLSLSAANVDTGGRSGTASLSLSAPAITSDDFTGSDDVNGVWNGTASTRSTPVGGRPWVSNTNEPWGISSNQIKKSTATTVAHLTVDSGLSDCVVEVDMTVPSGGANQNGLLVRYVDDNNFIEFVAAGSSWYVSKVVGGTRTNPGGAALSASASTTYNMRVELSGSSVKTYVDGVLAHNLTISDGALLSATKHGLRSWIESNTRWDNFLIKPLGARAVITGSASLSLSGTGVHSSVGTASISLSGSGAARGSLVATAALSVSATNSAVGVGRTGTASLGLSATGSGRASGVATASLSLSGAGSARGALTASAALSLSGAGVHSSVGTAALSLSGTGAARGALTSTAALSVSAANLAVGIGRTGTASLSLSAAGVHSSVGSGSLALSATGAARGALYGYANLSLDGTGAHSSVGSASLSLSASASAASASSLVVQDDFESSTLFDVIDATETYGTGATGGSTAIILTNDVPDGYGELHFPGFLTTSPGRYELSFWAKDLGGTPEVTAFAGFYVEADLLTSPLGTLFETFELTSAWQRFTIQTGFLDTNYVSGLGLWTNTGTQWAVDDLRVTRMASTGVAGAPSGSGSLSLSATGAASVGAVAASGTASLSLVGTGVHSSVGSASLSLSGSGATQGVATGSGSLSLSGSGTPQAVVTGSGSLALSGSGAAGHGVTGTASLALSATGVVQAANTSTGSIILTGSGTARATLTGSASLSVSGAGVQSSVGSASLSLSGSGAARAASTGSASLSLSGTGVQSSVGSASLSLTGSGAARVSAVASGALTLTAAGNAAFGTSGSASLSVSGAGTPVSTGVGTGSLTLSGTGTARAAAVATASLTLSSTGIAGYGTSGTASLSLSAAAGAATNNPTPVHISVGSYVTENGAAICQDTTTSSVAAGRKVFALIGWYENTTLSSVSGGGLDWEILGQTGGTTYHVAVASADAPAGLASGTTITGTLSGNSYARFMTLVSVDGLLDADGTYFPAHFISPGGVPPYTVSAMVTTASPDAMVFEFQWLDFSSEGSAPVSPATELFDIDPVDSQGTYQFYYQSAPTAGVQTISNDVSAPGRETTIAGFAFEKAPAAGVAAVATGTGLLSLSGTAATSSALSAAASLDLEASGDAGNARSGDAEIEISGSGTATSTITGAAYVEAVGTVGGTSTPITGNGSLTLAGSGVSRAAVASTASLSLSASGVSTARTSGTASLSLTGVLTAEGDVAASGTASLSLNGSGAGRAAAAATASLSLSGTATARATAAATASLSLSGSGAARGALTASGSLTLSGSGAAGYGTSGTASLSMSGSGTSAARLVGSGALSFSAIGEVEGAPTRSGTASLSLNGSGGAPTAGTTGSANMALAGTAQPRVAAAASAALSLTMTILPSGAVIGSGSMQLGASGGIAARPSGTASIAISGVGAGSASLGALAQLSLTALAQAENAVEGAASITINGSGVMLGAGVGVGFASLELRAFQTPRRVRNATAHLMNVESAAALRMMQPVTTLWMSQTDTHLSMNQVETTLRMHQSETHLEMDQGLSSTV